jgi:hypothetical protein
VRTEAACRTNACKQEDNKSFHAGKEKVVGIYCLMFGTLKKVVFFEHG